MIDDISLHGYGGQGVVACSELIAIAASIEGKFCRSFPMYGSARRGAPVSAFAQIGPENEATRSMVYHPKYLILMDLTMLKQENVTKCLQKDATIIVNTSKDISSVDKLLPSNIKTLGVLDATGIASQIIHRPIPNAPILGAFSHLSGAIQLDSIFKALEKRFNQKIAESNKQAAKVGYEKVASRCSQ